MLGSWDCVNRFYCIFHHCLQDFSMFWGASFILISYEEQDRDFDWSETFNWFLLLISKVFWVLLVCLSSWDLRCPFKWLDWIRLTISCPWLGLVTIYGNLLTNRSLVFFPVSPIDTVNAFWAESSNTLVVWLWKTWWIHEDTRGQRDDFIEFSGVECVLDLRQTVEDLCIALLVANVCHFGLVGDFNNPVDEGGDIIETHLTPTPIPVGFACFITCSAILSTVFGTTVVSHPYIKASINKLQRHWNSSKVTAYPTFGIHCAAMLNQNWWVGRHYWVFVFLSNDVEQSQGPIIFRSHFVIGPCIPEFAHESCEFFVFLLRIYSLNQTTLKCG